MIEGEKLLMPFQDQPFNGDIHACAKFIELMDRFQIKTAIELGSCVGGTTKWLSDNFEKVVSIEVVKEYLSIAKKRVADRRNVTFLFGSTVDVLPEILPWIEGQMILHVDSHWGPSNPLLRELQIIAKSGLKPVIEIHDFKVPDHPELGFDVYGDIVYEWGYIKDHIEKIYGADGFNVEYNDKATGAMRGIIYITPINK